MYNHNEKWDLPLEIFDNEITAHGYERFVVKDYFGDDNFDKSIRPLLTDSVSKIDILNRYAIHWCRSAITTGKWSYSHLYDINNPHPGTYLSLLYNKYSL